MIERTAARVIAKWLRKGNMARAMRDILPKSGLDFNERNKVAEIVHDVVRFKKYYDYILEKRGMKKTPENYILLSKEKPDLGAPRHIKYSMSEELATLSPEEFIPIINREPDTTLCINLKRISRKEAMEKLWEEGYWTREYIPESAVITDPAARYSSLINDGYAIVQDASSQIVAKITSSLGKRILDYCAGSGGKSLAMHSLGSENEFYAYDINSGKLRSLQRRAEKWGMQVHIFQDRPQGEFDVVLVDAPCSGVGAAARNPEAKYQEGFEKYAQMQLEILGQAKNYVKKDGFLVYVVCSYTSIETEGIIEKFLKDGNFEVADFNCKYQEYLRSGKFGSYILAGDIFYLSILKRIE